MQTETAIAVIDDLNRARVKILRRDPKSGAVTIADPIESTDRYGMDSQSFRAVTLKDSNAVARYLEHR